VQPATPLGPPKENTRFFSTVAKTPSNSARSGLHWSTPFKPADFHQLASPSLTTHITVIPEQSPLGDDANTSTDSPIPPCLMTTTLSVPRDPFAVVTLDVDSL
jgi:hypothetical protein